MRPDIRFSPNAILPGLTQDIGVLNNIIILPSNILLIGIILISLILIIG
jgi:hypothetical protein